MLSAVVNSGTYFHIRHKKPCSTHSLVLLHKPNCYPRRGGEKKSKVMICAFVGLDFNANLTPFLFLFFLFVGQRVLEHAMSTTTKKRVKTGWLLKHRQWHLLVCSITEKKRYWGFLVVVFFKCCVFISINVHKWDCNVCPLITMTVNLLFFFPTDCTKSSVTRVLSPLQMFLGTLCSSSRRCRQSPLKLPGYFWALSLPWPGSSNRIWLKLSDISFFHFYF